MFRVCGQSGRTVRVNTNVVERHIERTPCLQSLIRTGDCSVAVFAVMHMTAIKTEPASNPAQLRLFNLFSRGRWPNERYERMRLKPEVFVDEPDREADHNGKRQQDRCQRSAHAPHMGIRHLAVEIRRGCWLLDRGITPYMRTRDSALRKNNPGYGPERFTYLPESNSYRCPAGEQLNYVGLNVRNRAHAYIGSAKGCGTCSQKTQCTGGRYKYLAIHIHESARQRVRALANTPEFSQAQRERKKVEALFAELKNHIGLRRLRLRRMKFIREQFFLAATAQNIKRLVRYLVTPVPAVTT
jgi:Transposase DDE domain